MFVASPEAHSMSTCVAIDDDLQALLDHGAACVRVARRGKIPLGRAWNTLATTAADVIGGWLAGGYNVGILLGHGGLVDVEYDDAAGRSALERLGLAGSSTPTYTSGRGEHRIFRLVDPVPDCAWRKRGGIEVRYGGRPAQSVLPPSRHPDGGLYRWTISPRDCEPMPVRLADLSLECI
jgi:hypothetical protein